MGEDLMKRFLLLLPLLLGSLVGCSGANDFNYESGYRACIRFYFVAYKDDWEEMKKESFKRDWFRQRAHDYCK
tara:strand:+ start:139 stop:357 length:219 start_codon:yes stop_codon:yes gene_type:complete